MFRKLSIRIDTVIEQQSELLKVMNKILLTLTPPNDAQDVIDRMDNEDEMKVVSDRLEDDKAFRREFVSAKLFLFL